MAEKRYYWLKLKEDYFSSPKIKKLRKIAGGDTYTIIYLKMQLESIKNGGIIQFEGIEETFEEELALKLDEDVENVKITLAYLQSQSLLGVNENNEFLFVEASNSIGSEGQSAERKRRFEERKRNQPLLCNDSVTEEKRYSISISNSISNSNIYKDVINYLNEKANTNYRATTPKTKTLIDARLNEKFTLEDFKKVIDNKVATWKGTDMEKYLRPETLFGTKFEGYLNEKIKGEKNNGAKKEDYSIYDNL